MTFFATRNIGVSCGCRQRGQGNPRSWIKVDPELSVVKDTQLTQIVSHD
jgi:hypothetical protein